MDNSIIKHKIVELETEIDEILNDIDLCYTTNEINNDTLVSEKEIEKMKSRVSELNKEIDRLKESMRYKRYIVLGIDSDRIGFFDDYEEAIEFLNYNHTNYGGTYKLIDNEDKTCT